MVGWHGAAGDPTVAAVGEFGLIEGLVRQLAEVPAPGASLSVGIGDDTCAFLPTPGRELLATCDSLVEGRHFLPAFCSPEDVGRRAAAVNLSDVGAMGGQPRFALVSLGLRPETPVAAVEGLYRGLLAEFSPLGVAIAGGNCTAVAGACFVDVTLLGEVEVGRAVLRRGARPGDALLLTGHPGVGAAGLAALQGLGMGDPGAFPALAGAYRHPRHRAREGRELGLSRLVHAMIDVSDGLLGDVGHLARASGVGVTVEVEALPRHPELLLAADRLGTAPLDWMLGASDDYELLFACAPGDVDTLTRRVSAVAGVPVTRIGRVE
ncbi:MAG TPA: thiamine-phosphate kinase, partial [Deferrisomatales bacterium]|nr:thiamine-phosphate kinase [Deferrisomatales bacterium]